ncbi:uncharacterized protein SPPG_07993 [Spizellomyces punctatus DAOM BR117]|uniref:Uncharacterized protein n=1 Tax=Spizellomyces punctatus (strain DAOM BR117) TaxID=645134 RepID=A0A0L0H6E0_SPIPD|nr:uncharacterized protein SPPG_07993 [Spizellomyces punctatus DAOM BR117]KNC96787.1 hypothetical protein SPPG_07993 [Spizellomyces punctatus DAOM BR117]|eukprot:XP_016604827.1 hypothetical protein SPPG_07993 [Spizellomyces punctatus DAOM BR117]
MGQFSPAQGLPAEFRYDETLQAGLPAYQNIEDFFTDQWNPLPLAENTAGLPTPPTPQYVRASSPNVSILPPYHLPSPPLPSQILHTGTNTQQHLPPSTLSTPTARPMTSQGPNSLTFSIIPQPDQRSAQHDSSTQQRRSSAKFAPARPSTPNKSTRDTSGRKKIIDHTVHCKRCKNEIATFLLHPESKNVPPLNFAVDILCVSCEGRKDSLEVDDTSMVLAGRRKRLHDDYGMDCEICKRRIGSGGFKFSEERELQAIGVGGKVRDEDGAMVEEAMDFRVEPICASCRVKYKFCTECGGGGKFRTGKYRPVELFASNRRTCLLSHVRLGGAPVTYEVYLTPTNVCESLYNESREVHMDGFYGLYATPEVIEAAITQLESYAKVEEWANKGWRSAERLLREDVEKTRGLRRYLAVVYVEKPQSRVRGATIKRIKANAKNPHSTGPGLPPPQTTPSSTSTPSASPSFESSSPSGTATTPDHDSPRIQVAYGSAEWDISTGTVLFANGYVRTTTVSTLPILRGMHERLLRQCLTDSATVQAPVPVKHVWMLARRDHLRVQSYVERMGFKPLDEYVRMNPGVDKSLFEREVHVPRDLFRCFVCSVHEFLREGERERNGGVGGCGIGGGYRGVWR